MQVQPVRRRLDAVRLAGAVVGDVGAQREHHVGHVTRGQQPVPRRPQKRRVSAIRPSVSGQNTPQ